MEEDSDSFTRSRGTSNDSIYSFCRKPRKKRTTARRIDKSLREEYGITRQQLDIILLELCVQYQSQWSIVSTALYKEHRIKMNESRIKDRFTMYLDPKLKKQSFSFEEERDILKGFCIYGKRYKQFLIDYPDRDRYMIRSVLDVYFRKGFKMLQKYLWEEIRKLPKEELIGEGEVNKYDLLKVIVSEKRVAWKINKSTFKLLYFFMFTEPDNFYKVPKDLAMLLYKRIVEMRREIEHDNELRLKRIDPDLYTQLIEKQSKVKKRIQNYGKNNKYKKKKKGRSSTSEENQSFSDVSVKSEDISDMEEVNWSHLMQSRGEETNQVLNKPEDNFQDFQIQISPCLELDDYEEEALKLQE